MNLPEAVHPHDKSLIASGILALVGLGLGIWYVLHSTPYTMVVFLALGQAAIVAGGLIFLWVVFLDLRARLHSVVERRFQEGETVFRQGDYPDRLYLIGSGEAVAVKVLPDGSEVELARMKEGEFFGEIGILANTPRTATVRAATALETLSIHRSYLTSLLTYLPGWKGKVYEDYARRSARDRPAD